MHQRNLGLERNNFLQTQLSELLRDQRQILEIKINSGRTQEEIRKHLIRHYSHSQGACTNFFGHVHHASIAVLFAKKVWEECKVDLSEGKFSPVKIFQGRAERWIFYIFKIPFGIVLLPHLGGPEAFDRK